MNHGQLIPAFISALLAEGVEARQIEQAVERVRAAPLGKDFSGGPLHRAFANEQTRLLERGHGKA